MSPKNTEDAPLKKTEKEKKKIWWVKEDFYSKEDREFDEKLKESLKKQPPGRVERL